MALPALKAEVVALTEFRVKAAKWLTKLASSHTPMFITQRGRASAVLLTPEAYDRLVDLAATAAQPSEAVESVDRDAELPASLDDDSREVLRALRKKDRCSVDNVVELSGLPASRVLTALLGLELANLVRTEAGLLTATLRRASPHDRGP